MSDNLVQLVRRLGSPTVLVIGDHMLDRYIWGSADRISPEAPIPVLRADLDRFEEKPGGAASVAADVAALDAKPIAAGVLGHDDEGRLLLQLLRDRRINTRGLIVDRNRPTTLKTRMIARSQQMLRVDRESTAPLDPKTEAKLTAFCLAALPRADAVLIQDHGKGAVTRALVATLQKACRRRSIPIIADPAPRADFTKYHGVTVLTPNRSEACDGTGVRITDAKTADLAAKRLITSLGLQAAVITLDREGMAVAEKGRKTVMIPANALEVFDVTGAGDVVAAAIGVALASGHTLLEAAQLANVAAGIEVAKIGVATVSRREILEHLHGGMETKIKARPDLATICADLHSRGRTIVFTNGCFDLLHIGHVQLLTRAKKFGDVMIVAINSDASARRVKGPGRPIIPEDARAGMLAALQCVDYVTVYGEDTPIPLLKIVRPDVIVKGGEYGKKGVVGGNLVESMGGRIENVPMVAGFSTTKIAEKAHLNARKKTGGTGYVR